MCFVIQVATVVSISCLIGNMFLCLISAFPDIFTSLSLSPRGRLVKICLQHLHSEPYVVAPLSPPFLCHSTHPG